MMRGFGLLIALGLTLAIFGRIPFGKTVNALDLAEGDRGAIDENLALQLDEFSIPRYPSGKPRQYVSRIRVLDGGPQSQSEVAISVNHPLRRNGWWIYQYAFGPDGNGTICTQLLCVRDPMLPVAAAGGLLVLLGALGMCRGKNGRDVRSPENVRCPARAAVRWIAALAVVALPVFIIGRAVMRPEPVPALQSGFMAPHVAAYAASYLLLLFAAFGIGRRFVPLGFLLMTLGLFLGAVWGKFAWGEWWQFDPKENWSFFTWLAFALHLQLPPDSRAAKWTLRLGAALIVITLTWVNFSRLFAGLHSYA